MLLAVTCELKFLKSFLDSLRAQHSHAVSLYCDSIYVLYLINNKIFHKQNQIVRVIAISYVMLCKIVLLIFSMFPRMENW